jgi:hypothetical protein
VGEDDLIPQCHARPLCVYVCVCVCVFMLCVCVRERSYVSFIQRMGVGTSTRYWLTEQRITTTKK